MQETGLLNSQMNSLIESVTDTRFFQETKCHNLDKCILYEESERPTDSLNLD